MARIRVQGVSVYLGMFPSESIAKDAYASAYNRFFGGVV